MAEGADDLEVRFSDGTSCAAIVDKLAPHTDLALIRVQDHDLSVATLAPADSIKQGEPVISLGHPNLQDGEPSLAWGLVSATNRRIRLDHAPGDIGLVAVIQATYKSAGGSSGAPVFSLDGSLVGIHVAGTHEQGSSVPDFLASAVPVGDLARLMGDAQPDVRESSPPVDPATVAALAPRPHLDVTDFLGEIGSSPDGRTMLHQHWTDPGMGLHVVEQVIHTGVEDARSATLSSLAGPADFFRALRFVASWVDVSPLADASALSSCGHAASTQAEEQGDPESDSEDWE